MNEETKRQNIFNLKELFSILKNNGRILIISVILGFIISGIMSTFFISPKYLSSVDLLINQKKKDEQIQYTVQQADLQVINTYKDVIKKSVVLSPVMDYIKKNNNYQGSISDLKKSIEISNENQSQIVTVNVTDSNAYTAKDIANSIATVFTKKIKKIMKVDNVIIVSQAKVNTKPVSPNIPLYVLVGSLVGLFIGLMIVIVKELMDTKVRGSSFLTEDLGLIDLGVAFHIHGEDGLHALNVLKREDNNQLVRRRV